MKKLVCGIVEFRQKSLENYREKFAHLALAQSPDTLFIACSDSRVVPNLFVSTDPGDLFVVRNVGNLIPKCATQGQEQVCESEAAAIDFAVINLRVKDIVVCGHSECGAMRALVEGREKVRSLHLRSWLKHGEASLARQSLENSLSAINQLSQSNVLQQLEHLSSYPEVQQRLENGTLKLHAWWFDLTTANVFAYEEGVGKFVLIDEIEAKRILERLK